MKKRESQPRERDNGASLQRKWECRPQRTQERFFVRENMREPEKEQHEREPT